MSWFVLNNIIHIFRLNAKLVTRMAGKSAMERVKANAEVAKRTIDELKNELSFIHKEYNNMLAQQLREENARLSAAVQEAMKTLVELEERNGIQQIPIPNQVISCASVKEQDTMPDPIPSTEIKDSKPKKEKKEKKPKEQKEPAVELPVDIGRLDLRIGKVEDVQRHPDADSLYVLKINCGEDKPRTVCSGLVKHIPIDQLKDIHVVLLCNLKPVKMRGITSEAMVMCASSEAGVEVLSPPKGSKPGDLVQCEGYTRQPDAVMNPKKKIFETVAPDLHTNDDLQACYKNTPFQVEGKGLCLAKTLKNVPVK
ncbi:aminoacyl tRNA synthase complex-interacting multifunctional protein 1 [Anoplophora glabripennis]|uniref:aminoacyl tRNA synthase complex-interacting multifunctional protein 1 n=1 Tax=Anoplophora glabripennis TaxID=217634 RepID=UPI000873FFA4|nr:aminoacyl tRNA synthase complex-interacting multifunctional protein 1 [Anoplophora glabripennis]